jgi:asparagine synthase (glutamine-hydrolysing)
MCGIFGYYNFGQPLLSDDQVAMMGSSISHRGPDGQGYYHDAVQGIALGNQRLAILDIEHGQQPFYSDDKSIVVVQNGEIFNHVELAKNLSKDGYCCKTHCDTEVILKVYERDGIEGVKCLNGMFAIAIFDKNLGKLFLIRDRVGEKPYHYYWNGESLVFASEIKSILQVIPKPDVCLEAMDHFFAFNYVPSPITMFENIFHVQPGHYLEIDMQGVKDYCWWDLSNIKEETKTEDEWVDLFNDTLDDAVRIRLRSDVPFGAFLSGGVDSSTIVGIMDKHMTQPVKTYCIGFDNPKYDESPYAQEAADRFSTEHHLQVVDPDMLSLWKKVLYHCDQPHGDVSFMPTYKVAEMAAADVKMVLTGDGADELFAGYDKYKIFFNFEDGHEQTEDCVFRKRYAQNLTLFDHSKRNNLFSNEVKEELTTHDVNERRLEPMFSKVAHMDHINQALYIDTMLLLSGNNLVKPDRMGMAASIENRAPFLDFRMIELAFKMPGELKLKNGETKYIYKKAVSNLIGEHLAYRKKQMFTVPVGDWFKDKLRPLCENLLLSKKTKARKFFNYEYVQEIFEKHCSGESNNTREIRALMAFEYWCRIFLDNDIDMVG